MRLATISLLLLFALTPAARAQNKAELEKMMSRLDTSLDALEKLHSNISAMSIGVPEREYLSAIMASAQIERALNSYSRVMGTSSIASVMLDDRDYKLTLRFLMLDCRSAKKIGENSNKTINSILVKITSIALVGELSKARDLIHSLANTPICK